MHIPKGIFNFEESGMPMITGNKDLAETQGIWSMFNAYLKIHELHKLGDLWFQDFHSFLINFNSVWLLITLYLKNNKNPFFISSPQVSQNVLRTYNDSISLILAGLGSVMVSA